MAYYDGTRSDHHRDAVIGFILTKDPHLLFIALTAWTSLLGLSGNFINYYYYYYYYYFINQDPECFNWQLAKLSRTARKEPSNKGG